MKSWRDVPHFTICRISCCLGTIPKWHETQTISLSCDSAKFWQYLSIDCNWSRSGPFNSFHIATEKKFAKVLQNRCKRITEQRVQKIEDDPHFLSSTLHPRCPILPFPLVMLIYMSGILSMSLNSLHQIFYLSSNMLKSLANFCRQSLILITQYP